MERTHKKEKEKEKEKKKTSIQATWKLPILKLRPIQVFYLYMKVLKSVVSRTRLVYWAEPPYHHHGCQGRQPKPLEARWPNGSGPSRRPTRSIWSKREPRRLELRTDGVGLDRRYARPKWRPGSQLEIFMVSRSGHMGPATCWPNATMMSLTEAVMHNFRRVPCTSSLESKYKPSI